MATGLLDFKAKYRGRLTEAITALSSGREFYCEGKFHPDPGSAIAMMMYSCVWDAFNEEGAKFNSRKLEYNASFWAKEIVCCHRVPYTNKGLLTPDSLRYYRTMGESGIQSLERLLQWLLEEEPPNNNYDTENKKIVGEAIVDIGESVSECIEVHASTSQNTQFRLLALAKNFLPSEGSCNYQESQATKTGDLYLERHGGALCAVTKSGAVPD